METRKEGLITRRTVVDDDIAKSFTIRTTRDLYFPNDKTIKVSVTVWKSPVYHPFHTTPCRDYRKSQTLDSKNRYKLWIVLENGYPLTYFCEVPMFGTRENEWGVSFWH